MIATLGRGYTVENVHLPLHLFVVLSNIAFVEMIVPYLKDNANKKQLKNVFLSDYFLSLGKYCVVSIEVNHNPR